MIKIGSDKFRLEVKGIQKSFKKMKKEILGSGVMKGIAEQGLTIIHNRTSKGKDVDGKPFAHYTDKYAKAKASGKAAIWARGGSVLGRRKTGAGRNISKVDLTLTGKMLGAMQSKFTGPGKSEILFSRGEEAAKAGGNERKRKFFSIENEKEIDALVAEGQRLIDKEIKRMGL